MMTHYLQRFAAILLPCLLMLFAAAGCNQQPKTSDDDIVRIEHAELERMMQSTKAADQIVMVDPRPDNTRREKTIMGSLHIPMQDMTADDPRLVAAGRIVVFGSNWQDALSDAAAKRLIALRYRRVFVYRGGVSDWESRGGTVVRVQQPTPAN